MPTPQEMAKTMSIIHSFRRRMEAARDLLTPLSKKPTSRVPHSVLVLTFFGILYPTRRVEGPSIPTTMSTRHMTTQMRPKRKEHARHDRQSEGKYSE